MTAWSCQSWTDEAILLDSHASSQTWTPLKEWQRSSTVNQPTSHTSKLIYECHVWFLTSHLNFPTSKNARWLSSDQILLNMVCSCFFSTRMTVVSQTHKGCVAHSNYVDSVIEPLTNTSCMGHSTSLKQGRNEKLPGLCWWTENLHGFLPVLATPIISKQNRTR